MQTNLDFKNPLKTTCWILSILSWLLFLVTGWMGFSKLARDEKLTATHPNADYNIWSFLNYVYLTLKDRKFVETEIKDIYLPIQSKKVFYIILFVILMILGTVAFFIYLFKSVIKKDDHVFEGMMGTFSRFHFTPLVCASALFLAGYTQEKTLLSIIVSVGDKDQIDKYKGEFSVNLFFCILGLLTLIFVKMQTKIENPIYVVYSIKDGLYPVLIALFNYCLFYSSYYIGLLIKIRDYNQWEDIPKFTKNCGIWFSIIIGVINLCVSFILKDFILPIINLIIYLGLVIRFFDMSKEERNDDNVTNAEGIIEIVVIVLSAVVFALLIFLKRK